MARGSQLTLFTPAAVEQGAILETGGRSRGSIDVAPGVVGATHEGAGLDVAEAQFGRF
jgi:hypothetical protein